MNPQASPPVTGIQRPPRVPDTHLAGADGLRALACLGVIAHHYAQRLKLPADAGLLLDVQALLVLGNCGVSVFFVLSGFLLSLPFWRGYLRNSGFPKLASYAVRRAARIVPGYYVALFGAVALAWQLGVPTPAFWPRLIAGLGFVSGFHYTTFFPTELDAPLWSISFEVFSYLLMPLFMSGLFLLRRVRRSIGLGVAYWCAVFVVVLALNQWVISTFVTDPSDRGWEFGLIGGAKSWMPGYNPVGFFGHFVLGILAAGFVAGLDSPAAGRFDRYRRGGLFDALALGALAGVSMLLWFNRHSAGVATGWQGQPFLFPYFGALVAIGLSALPLTLRVGHALDNPPFRYTAKVSFGLYIWHYPVIVVADYWANGAIARGIPHVGSWVLVCVGLLAASYVLASISYRLIEKPAIDWGHRRTSGRSGRVGPA